MSSLVPSTSIARAECWQRVAAFAIAAALSCAVPAAAQTTAVTPAVTAAGIPAGDVANVKGEASAQAQSAPRALAAGAPVFVDETVTTAAAARLTLNLGRSTIIKLGEKVRIRLDKHMVNAGGAFDLQSGAMLFDRGAGAPKAETAFRSPYGLMVVRGTRFFAGPSNGVFGVFVTHGRVDVTGGGKTVRLTAGLGTNITTPGAAPSKPAAWKEPRIKAAIASVE